jgi:hypothetical protein
LRNKYKQAFTNNRVWTVLFSLEVDPKIHRLHLHDLEPWLMIRIRIISHGSKQAFTNNNVTFSTLFFPSICSNTPTSPSFKPFSLQNAIHPFDDLEPWLMIRIGQSLSSETWSLQLETPRKYFPTNADGYILHKRRFENSITR